MEQYRAAAYARASKEEADSTTIENQIELIQRFAQERADIRIVSVRTDSGFSGIDFLRPAFGALMQDIEGGRVNCVIVKDLSRLGRNYIEVGELMEDILPRLGVRLIAVNDNYDSLNPRSAADDILIPFRNLINEQYLRDNSLKTRTALETKRRNGAFVAPSAPYGYVRDANDRHRLQIDQAAARVVRDIFRWRLQGLSPERIACRLEENGEPSPAEYKRRNGSYHTAFQTRTQAAWSAVTVGRILRNPMYMGTLVQGKRTTPSYKVHREILLPESEWCQIPNAHEPIIHKDDFAAVNRLPEQYSRAAPGQWAVYPLSGLVFCGHCGNNMIRKKTHAAAYYVCAARKGGEGCSAGYVRQDCLENALLETVRRQIACLADTQRVIAYGEALSRAQSAAAPIRAAMADREREIEECRGYKQSLYEDCKNGFLSREDAAELRRSYTGRIRQLTQAAEVLRSALLQAEEGQTPGHGSIEYFRRHRTAESLSRVLAVCILDRIEVYSGRAIRIRFRCRDPLRRG